MASSRLPQRDDVNALSIDLHFEVIDLIVVFENLAGDFAVALAQCIHRTIECLFGFTAQQEHAIAK